MYVCLCVHRSITNPVEACIVTILCHAMTLAGVDPSEIGVVAPYRAQLTLLQRALTMSACSSMYNHDHSQAGTGMQWLIQLQSRSKCDKCITNVANATVLKLIALRLTPQLKV